MADSKEKLFSDFPAVSTEQWMEKITADLKGADFEKKLVWRTNEGFKVKPFYRQEDLEGLKTTEGLPGEFPYVRGTKKNDNMDRLFPVQEKPTDRRIRRIVAPCGNETWKQCSAGCTKDIWEPDEVPSGICPHCGAPLTGNTIEAHPYIEEGYLPQWNRYTQWLTGTFNKDLVILELGVGFANPGVIRFPFEKTAFFNQGSFFLRVNQTFPQTTEELKDRARGVHQNSVDWMIKSDYNVE